MEPSLEHVSTSSKMINMMSGIDRQGKPQLALFGPYGMVAEGIE